ncbi:MAG: hypothetical protein WC558_02320 [Patulibacter sp.]
MDDPDLTTRSRFGGWLPWVAFAVLCVGLLALFLAYPTYPNYDSYYTLLWAREIWDGQKPVFDAFRAPTEHPLSILFSLFLTPFGIGVDRFLVFCAMASVAALAAGVYQLAKVTFNRWVGLTAGVLLLVNWNLIYLAVRGYLDVTYIALVVWAAVLEARRPRRGWSVLLMLALAGLLRPEAWVLCGLYGLWMAWNPSFRAIFTPRGIAWLAASVVPTGIWLLVDYLVTGEPLFSLTHTSDLAESLGRTQSPLQIPFSTISYLKGLDGTALFYAGLAGMLAVAVVIPKRLGWPFVLFAAGIGTFFLIGFGGFSVIDRYLMVASVMLLVFAAFLLTGWTVLAPGRLRNLWRVVAALAVIGVAVVAVDRVQPGSIDNDLTFRGEAHDDLVSVLQEPDVQQALRCGPVWTPNHKLVPDVRWILDAPASKVIPRSLLGPELFEKDEKTGELVGGDSPDRVTARREVPDAATGGQPTRGILVLPSSRIALLRQAYVTVGDDRPFDAIPLSGFERIATSRHYVVYSRCG